MKSAVEDFCEQKSNNESRIESVNKNEEFPQDQEENEYRYIDPFWLNMLAYGLTAGARKHPGETWRSIPAKEHASRALRHLNLFLMGDRSESHLLNASMRTMMAFCTNKSKECEESKLKGDI